MVEIQDIFFCDSVVEGQFSKIDIIGFNGSDTIGIKGLPYTLVTNIVVKGYADSQIPPLEMKITYLDKEFKELLSSSIPFSLPSDLFKPTSIFCAFKTTYKIEKLGTLKIQIISESSPLILRSFHIIDSDAPLLSHATHSIPSILVTRPTDIESGFIVNLFSQANRILRIIDNYLRPDDLQTLLTLVDIGTDIRVIAKNKYRDLYNLDFGKFSRFSNLEIRFSDSFHDRFFVLNDSEFYHSGHSLNEITQGKVTRISKITGKDESARMLELFNTEWNKGTSLK